MPPLRSVISCSPSARARTVTAHSLKAVGIGERGSFCPRPRRALPPLQGRSGPHSTYRDWDFKDIPSNFSGGFLLNHLDDGSKVLLTEAFSVRSRVVGLGLFSQPHPGAQALGLGQAVTHVLQHVG